MKSKTVRWDENVKHAIGKKYSLSLGETLQKQTRSIMTGMAMLQLAHATHVTHASHP